MANLVPVTFGLFFGSGWAAWALEWRRTQRWKHWGRRALVAAERWKQIAEAWEQRAKELERSIG